MFLPSLLREADKSETICVLLARTSAVGLNAVILSRLMPSLNVMYTVNSPEEESTSPRIAMTPSSAGLIVPWIATSSWNQAEAK